MCYAVTIKRAKLAVLESQRHEQETRQEKWSQGRKISGSKQNPVYCPPLPPQLQRPLRTPYLLFVKKLKSPRPR